MQAFLRPNFDRLRTEPDACMRECFDKAHKAIYAAIKSQPGTFEKDMGDGKGPMLVMEVDEEDWDLGYDAVDGGSTASVAADARASAFELASRASASCVATFSISFWSSR